MTAVDEAKQVIEAHEKFVAAGDLQGVLNNMHEDVAFMTADMPMVEGRDAVKRFYEGIFALGTWQFRHHYSSATEIDGLLLLHGMARGIFTPDDGDASSIANNFMITMRRISDGHLKVWRAAFAPCGE
jgi:ketosteroid isomerase-like protein